MPPYCLKYNRDNFKYEEMLSDVFITEILLVSATLCHLQHRQLRVCGHITAQSVNKVKFILCR